MPETQFLETPRKSYFQTEKVLFNLGESALALESAIDALDGFDVPGDRAAGLRNHLNRLAEKIARALDRQDLSTAIAAATQPKLTRDVPTNWNMRTRPA